MSPRRNSRISCTVLAIVFCIAAVTGCAGNKQAAAPKAVAVKTMKTIKRDVTIADEYAGQVQGKNEARIQARVSGNVVQKMVNGGEMVKKGQPLFKIDDRPYVSSLLSAQSQLAQAEASLANTEIDTQRYRNLYKASAIAEQQLTTQESALRQQKAVVNSQRALAQKSQDDLTDTLVVSPIDGRLYVDDVSVGTYVQAGSTVLVTVGILDPVFVQFSMSENEYLNLRQLRQNSAAWGEDVSITLSNGSVYPLHGKVAQVDRGMANNTGTLTVKASFPNPDAVLVPGMFARVKIDNSVKKDALLVPQRAVQQVLEKSYVMVVDENKKAKACQVTLGKKVGSFWLVESGLMGNENIVVEGLTKVQEGIALEPAEVTPQDLGLIFN